MIDTQKRRKAPAALRPARIVLKVNWTRCGVSGNGCVALVFAGSDAELADYPNRH